MNVLFDFRFLLAATVLLAVLAGAYGAAVRGPLTSLGATMTHSKTLTNPPVCQTDDTTAWVTGQGAAARRVPSTPAPAAPPSSRPTENEEAPPCRPQPLRLTEEQSPGPRRYVGTVGGERATAEIDWSRPDSLSGRFYLWRSGQEYEFSQSLRHQPRVLVLGPPVYPLPQRAGEPWLPGGQWRLGARPGPVLRGTWVDAAGHHPRPFVLRESYQGGVRYDIRQLTLTGGPGSPDSCDVPLNYYEFLHLLGPAATRPPLSWVQCPSRAGRRRQLLADYNQETHNEYGLDVKLNDFGLLSYQLDYTDSPFKGTGGFAYINVLIDLVSGRQLTITSQFRPGYELPLRRLLARRLLGPQLHELDHGEDNPERYGWEQLTDHGQRVKLPYLPYQGTEDDTAIADTWVLCAQGLKIGAHLDAYRVTISYPELRPLVRPGTPLARMLRARGLW